MIHDAQYYKKLTSGKIKCLLCPAECSLKPGQYGICRCRFNDNGVLKTENFGETVTVALDPIEKKPLYHFLPTTDIISIGANGCNFSCRHCQNWQISQEKVSTTYINPIELPRVAGQRGSVGIAYTYTEPLIWYEYIMESAPLIHEAGLVNVIVTNGYINLEPLERLLPFIDAFNVDLKGMRPDFYTRICKGKLEPVLKVIERIADSPAHLEVTNLVIPGINDKEEDFHKLGKFLGGLNERIPLHLSAYHPSYKMSNPRTSVQTLKSAFDINHQYLRHVFIGNMEIEGCSNTCCDKCGQILIERSYYNVKIAGLDESGNCSSCGNAPGIILNHAREMKS